jgi:CMP/dCMP kinase
MNFKNTIPLTITIDGPSASGKGTVAQMISEYFSIPHLNSGLIYRKLAFVALQKKCNLENDIKKIIEIAKDINLNDLNANELSSEEIGFAASIIGNNTEIRKALLNLQKKFITESIENFNGCVLDGRDMGTVIYPEAAFKFFITASAQQRAKRRFEQENNKNFDEILESIIQRDKRDEQRVASPLKPSPDAVIIDNSSINAEETFKIIIKNINEYQN